MDSSDSTNLGDDKVMNDNSNMMDLSDSPHVGGHKMSSSLKERLKRSSRAFASPIAFSNPLTFSSPRYRLNTPKTYQQQNKDTPITAQQLNKDTPTTAQQQKLTEDPPIDSSKIEKTCSDTLKKIQECQDKEELQTIFLKLQKEAEIKEELLRKLKLVEKHHAKNTPDALTSLTEKWLITTQNALERLLELLNDPKPDSMGTLIDLLQIDRERVQYNPETDGFFETSP